MLLQTCFHFVATQISEYFLMHGSPFYQPFFQVIILHHSKHDDKPTQPYIDPIRKAILSSSQQTLELSDIYDYIQANYPYFRDRGTGWRNSIRHNLSLNDCFVKVGRSPNGKGHFWAINPINYSVEVNTKGKEFREEIVDCLQLEFQ